MNDNVKYYLFYTILYGIILLAGEGLHRYLRLNPARSRNFSHLVAGLVSLPYPWFFSSHWWVLLLAVQSSVVLYVTRYYGFIPSHHKTAGRSLGSFLFFVSIYICYTASSYAGNISLFVIPILVLSISDVTASIVGQRFGKRPISMMKLTSILKPSGILRPTSLIRRFGATNKTYAGSLAFFISSMVIVFAVFQYYLGESFFHSILMALAISVATTFSEAISPNGFDNLTIPLTTLIIIWLSLPV